MKNIFTFFISALFVLKIFKFLYWLFSHVQKRLVWKDEVKFKIYDVTTWETNNCNTHIAQYLTKQRKSGNDISSVYTRETFFLKYPTQNVMKKLIPDLFL